MTREEATARQDIRAYVAERLKGQRKVKLPALADAVTDHFQQDANFLRRFAADYLRRAVYDVAIEVIAGRRQPVDVAVSMNRMTDAAPSVWGRWENQLEHVGDSYVCLLDLTRESGAVAIAERRKRAEGEERMAALIERLITPLKQNQKIRSYWKPQQVQAVAEELQPKDAAA